MRRGDLYRVYKGSKNDTKDYRIFVVVSRQLLINSSFSTLICAPVYSRHDGLSTQVSIDIDEGIKHFSSIHCDELVSIPKYLLTNYIGKLSYRKMQELDNAIKFALDIT
ncbi:MAG: type II toxin-antitoxin system PemK/MazF family toxin [Chitinivibrionia bacterium]|nr:type II toxin-antitoxin system PemK/MazF family toxin [Chitinivibrionia bacterium]